MRGTYAAGTGAFVIGADGNIGNDVLVVQAAATSLASLSNTNNIVLVGAATGVVAGNFLTGANIV